MIAPGANAANRSGRKSALPISLQPALVGWLSHYFIRVVEMGDKELLFDFRPFSLSMQPVSIVPMLATRLLGMCCLIMDRFRSN